MPLDLHLIFDSLRRPVRGGPMPIPRVGWKPAGGRRKESCRWQEERGHGRQEPRYLSLLIGVVVRWDDLAEALAFCVAQVTCAFSSVGRDSLRILYIKFHTSSVVWHLSKKNPRLRS
jgi:hypothetical protein